MRWSCAEKKKTSLPLVLFEVEDEAVAVAVAVAVAGLRSLENILQKLGDSSTHVTKSCIDFHMMG